MRRSDVVGDIYTFVSPDVSIYTGDQSQCIPANNKKYKKLISQKIFCISMLDKPNHGFWKLFAFC